MKELLLVINEDRFFLSHRVRIAENAAKNGWDVTLVTKDTGLRNKIEEMGFNYIELPINPTGMKPGDELETLRFLYRLYRNHPDAIIHHVGLKNMLWGGLASRLTKTKGVLYAVSGLGTLFGENNMGVVSKMILRILKFSMSKKNVAIIFQNHDDEKLFLDKKLIEKNKINFIKGSGVDLNEYSESKSGKGSRVVIVFTGRMLREKGVIDLINAAELLRNDYRGRIEFWLCGGVSNNPCALKEDEIRSLVDDDYIKWLGHRSDISEILGQADIMCFPSYYREGVPKSLIEASASGLPIVTTDSVGCRDTVEEGVNGFIVPPHDPGAIAAALKRLIEDKDLREKMGKASRIIAERDYDVEKVAEKHLQIYEALDSVSGK